MSNLTSDFADGKAFVAIINRADPDSTPLEMVDDPMTNVQAAFEVAEAKYGVPTLIDTEDPDFWKAEKAMVPQIAEFMKRLPKVEEVDSAVDEAAAAAEAAAVAEAEAAAATAAAEEASAALEAEAAACKAAEEAAAAAAEEEARVRSVMRVMPVKAHMTHVRSITNNTKKKKKLLHTPPTHTAQGRGREGSRG